jgi:hypothetical protein
VSERISYHNSRTDVSTRAMKRLGFTRLALPVSKYESRRVAYVRLHLKNTGGRGTIGLDLYIRGGCRAGSVIRFGHGDKHDQRRKTLP